jgi:hypothetical protein
MFGDIALERQHADSPRRQSLRYCQEISERIIAADELGGSCRSSRRGSEAGRE